MSMRLKVVFLLLAVLVLAGCNTRMGRWMSGSGGNASADDPAALLDFEQTLQVERLWQRNIGRGERQLGLRQAPTVAEGRVYVTDVDGDLVAIDAGSGDVVWRTQTGLRLSASPGVAAGTIVTGSLDGDVVAFDADSGAERWRAQVSSEVIARPLLIQGLAIVRSIDGRVSALDLGNGSRRWLFERGTPSLSVRGMSPAAAGQGLVYVGADDGTLTALRLQDGVRVWEQIIAEPEGRTELERMADIDGEIRVGLGEVYAASFGGQVMALEAASGRPLWARDLQSYAGTALTGRHLVAADLRSNLWALDRNSSSALWRQEALANRWVTSPAVQSEHVLVGDAEGYVHWFNLESGAPAARTRLGRQPIRATPQVSPEGVAYVIDVRGQLAAYRVSRR